ncbi:MAG: tRNA uridine-5-carboxymethylaminomethyl(34) synthesis GTPase MnmE [Methylobacteriaceae bacterium]|nr:tRNA uridine-5-carboxymethylaminomethyl(34) synthesis GTPase MnmE [Methylobacteriaceae bacterium]
MRNRPGQPFDVAEARADAPVLDDVIFAPACAPGRAAVSIVRLSGSGAAGAVEALCGAPPPPRLASLRRLVGRDGPIDEALVLWFPAPASFTGEDVAEFHLHGSRAVLRAVLAELGRRPGLRPAEPGEFARRAFRNGKRDLASLEGLADLIDAETEAQRRQALEQLSGAAGRMAQRWSEALLDLQAEVESDLDFSDEADVQTDLTRVRRGAARLAAEMAAAVEGVGAAARLRDGFRIAIAGPPNVGKSSLLNAIAARDVAIVADSPGTTRDVLDTPLDLGGLPVTLSDTAGQRESTDPIEAEGVRRARARAADADLVWWLARTEAETEGAPAGATIVASQRDRFASDPSPRWADIAISAQTGLGLPELLARAQSTLAQLAAPAESAAIVRERHREATEAARASLLRIEAGVGAPELVAEELRLARRAIGRIVGATDVEQVLGVIFSRFCIGK